MSNLTTEVITLSRSPILASLLTNLQERCISLPIIRALKERIVDVVLGDWFVGFGEAGFDVISVISYGDISERCG